MASQDIALMAHLLRRAGFGASRDEIEACLDKGYEATVEGLLNPEQQPGMEDDLIDRYNPGYYHCTNIELTTLIWIHRMINSPRQLQEKMALFWHTILCVGQGKVEYAIEMTAMLDMFREKAMGGFRDLLVELSKNPAMLFYLDNIESHKGAVNENYGRELLELFSMGVGKDQQFNYTEDDVKVCSQAFTGWNLATGGYPPNPYGNSRWHFIYDPADHDDSMKTFLGEAGRWNGEDVIDIICQQPATARFVARHLYNFFVADEPSVPSWRLTPPRDMEAVKALEKAYFDSNYNMTSILRVLFNSDFFKSGATHYQKVKSPAEVVAGAMRLVGLNRQFNPGMAEIYLEPRYMGQDLLNPPTVEGWHTGAEWIDSGTLLERINFVSSVVGDISLPGVRSIINRLMANRKALSPDLLVDGCLDLVGPIETTPRTKEGLLEHARQGGELRHGTPDERAVFNRRVADMLQLIVATPEYQFV